jgi:hypothetical protein
MIEPGIDARALDGHHVLHVLHHADLGMVSAIVGANLANLVIADVVTVGAVFHLIAQAQKAVGQCVSRLGVFAQQVQNQAQCRFASHARQFRGFRHGTFEQL